MTEQPEQPPNTIGYISVYAEAEVIPGEPKESDEE